MSKEFELKCPCCEGIQYCPCPSCAGRHKKTLVWKLEGMTSSCGYCGYTMSVEGWLSEQDRQHKEWKSVQSPELLSSYSPNDQEDDGDID